MANEAVDVAYISTIKLCEVYVELLLICRQKGRALSEHDIWIASIAHDQEAQLVTFDRDFMVLQDQVNIAVLSTD